MDAPFHYNPWLHIALVVITTALFAICAWLAARNCPLRVALDAVLGPKGPAVPKSIVGWYGTREIRAFADATKAKSIDGANALERYCRPMLLRNDIWFAVTLSSALIFLNATIAPSMPLGFWGSALAGFCGAMGLIYGLADVLENVKLANILSSGVVKRRDAFLASLYTQIKFASLYLALPAALGLIVKSAHEASPSMFDGALKLVPLLAIVAAALIPRFARVLWASRVSIVSVFAGYGLFLFVIQAQDLFADTTYGDRRILHLGYWGGAYAGLAILWALPVHFAARAALEGRDAAPYILPDTPGWMIKWTPRILGLAPVLSFLIGIFGAAIATRNATHLEYGLELQYALLSLGGWITLAVVFLLMAERKRIVRKFFGAVESARAQIVQKLCAGVTAILFILLVCAPLWSTQFIARAALVPVLLGSGVLFFGALGRASDRTGRPIIGFFLLFITVLTASNYHFHDLRVLPSTEANKAVQMTVPSAVSAWREANNCGATDGQADRTRLAQCPPVLIVAAEGGASRAAYFTAIVVGALLERLKDAGGACGDKTNPGRCIFAMSGVSGGSLGLAAVKAVLLEAKDGPPCKDPTSWSECIKAFVEGDYLSPTFIGLGFRDNFAPPVSPFNNDAWWGDRAALLEASWEQNALHRLKPTVGLEDGKTGKVERGFNRPFAQGRPDQRWTPLLLLNGTSVETGRRVIASELAPVWMKRDNSGRDQPQVLHQWAYDLFEILAATCGKDVAPDAPCAANNAGDKLGETNIRLSTAALMSARFPIISPPGAIHMAGTSSSRGDSLVDGGYFENSGLTTALDVAAAIHSMGLYPIILSISNDVTPTTPASHETDKTTDCNAPRAAPELSTLRLKVGKPASDSFWVRAIEGVYAPLMALNRTRDSHAEEAGRVMSQYLQAWDFPEGAQKAPCLADRYAAYFPIKVYAKGPDFWMPQLSMSWWLSPVIRKTLSSQLGIGDNPLQLDLLIRRLSSTGCPNCQVEQESMPK